MRLKEDTFQIATPVNCSVTQKQWEQILKNRANRFDAPKGFKIQIQIFDADLAVGKMQHSSCAVANSCTRENFLFKHVTRDVAFIGILHNGEPKIIRLRSGELPRKFDRLHAMVEAGEIGLVDLYPKLSKLRTNSYVLRAFSDSQTLEAKRGVVKKAPKAKRNVGPRNASRDGNGYLTRGTVIV